MASEDRELTNVRRLLILNILSDVRAELVARSKTLVASLRICLAEANKDVKDAQALLVRLADHGSSKDKQRAAELVKNLEIRMDTIKEGMEFLQIN